MDIAGEIFRKKKVVRGRLEKAGFVEVGEGVFEYREEFMNGDLVALIRVEPDGRIRCSAVDSASGEEYLPMNIEAHTGSYVGEAREEYKEILEKAAKRCFDDLPFRSDQANRISVRIGNELGAEPEFPFSKKGDTDAAVFRHTRTGKWFAIVMMIKRGKLDTSGKASGEPDGKDAAGLGGKDAGELINVMNVKIDPDDLADGTGIGISCRKAFGGRAFSGKTVEAARGDDAEARLLAVHAHNAGAVGNGVLRRDSVALLRALLGGLCDELKRVKSERKNNKNDYVIPEIAEKYLGSKAALSIRIQNFFQKAGIETKIENERCFRKSTVYGFHSFRHGFVSLCAANGIPMNVVMELVGHRSAMVHEIYQHATAEQKIRAINVIEEEFRQKDEI